MGGGTAELYDPKTDSATPTGNLLVVQSVLAATVLANGNVLVLGTHDVEVYDSASGSFSLSGSYAAAPGTVTSNAVALTNGQVLVFGGNEQQLFDPTANSFSLTGSLSGTALDGMDLFSATLLKDGRVLVAGGMGDWRTNAAVIYDPVTGEFAPTGSMNDARDAHAAALLLDGRVLVLGGDGWSCSGSDCPGGFFSSASWLLGTRKPIPGTSTTALAALQRNMRETGQKMAGHSNPSCLARGLPADAVLAAVGRVRSASGRSAAVTAQFRRMQGPAEGGFHTLSHLLA